MAPPTTSPTAPIETVACDVLVIGAGVVGLAVAATMDKRLTTVLVESHSKFGQETSSRNSEVIHSGIHYPRDSKKTAWCIEGRGLLYSYCQTHGVAHRRAGKLVVATVEDEESYLEKLAAHCNSLGVPHQWLDGAEVTRREPLVRAKRALFFPETGIVDSHQFMAALERDFLAQDGLLAYHHRVTAVERSEENGGAWRVHIAREDGAMVVEARRVVNAAGLAAAELSNLALGTRRFEHRYCRGRYFTLSAAYQNRFTHLVYPCPPKDGLGVHVTVDIDGYARLGPDVEWCHGVTYAEVNRLYDCDWEALRAPFLAAALRYCPSLRLPEVSPSQIGIRPKLFLDGAASPDFLVEDHKGWIHCLGIESPGLTSALAIAREVKELVGEA